MDGDSIGRDLGCLLAWLMGTAVVCVPATVTLSALIIAGVL